MKKQELNELITFSSNHLDFEERVNLSKESLSLTHIITFRSILEDENYFQKIIVNHILDNNVTLSIDDKEVNETTLKEVQDFDDESVKITITYSLLSDSENILFYYRESLRKCISDMLSHIKIGDIINIQNDLKFYILEEKIEYKIGLNTYWSSLRNDSNYFDKSPLILQNFIPNEFQKNLSKEIFEAFIHLIAERKIEDEYLIRLGNAQSVHIPNNFELNMSEISTIYLIIKYIFDDEYRYDDKLQIFRNILTDCLFSTGITEVKWFKILQILKDNYSLFIDEKLVEYNKLRISLVSQILDLKQKIEKSVDSKVDEFSKQILIIVATILSSFIVKIGSNNQYILIISAIAYVILILIFNLTKGVHFSSVSFEENIEDIKEIRKKLKALEYSSDYEALSNNSEDVNKSLKKLYIIEILQFALLLAITLGLIAMLVIA
ncbi:hypothetical protein [Lactococcus petauri]|uniref:hypothetical protein n=1 Tax=Lactococcus petauri TaxID=1940789 RepID=UPI0023ED3E00|nr:hypothetical protein [Lactococcus petauri]